MSMMSQDLLRFGSLRGFALGDEFTLALIFVGVALFTAIVVLSKQEEWGVPTAMVYLLLGGLAAAGMHLLDIPQLDPTGSNTELMKRLTEFAVIIALFAAGLRIDRPMNWRAWHSTSLLILVVMPLTIAGVALFANLVMGLSLGAAILLGAILAPTDPVLAASVGADEPGEGDSEPKFALTSESGLNDGLAFPFVLLGIFIAVEGGTSWVAEWVLADVIYAIAVGLILGAGVGILLSRLVDNLTERGLISREMEGWIAVAAVLAIYGLTELVGAYGFIAAFAGGLAFRKRPTRTTRHHRKVHGGAETVERVAELALILLLGSTLTTQGLAIPGISGWLLAPLLLLVIRPLLVLTAFAGSRLELKERIFVGWFGIRGLGSFYYAAVAFGTGALALQEKQLIFWTTVVVVGLSIVLHGLTAAPFAKRIEKT
jgi:NhaP-type Na+/H+ or K+/H+ antiporter